MTPKELATQSTQAMTRREEWPPCESLTEFALLEEIPVLTGANSQRIVKLEHNGLEFISAFKDGQWIEPMPWPSVWKIACYDQMFGERDCRDSLGVLIFFNQNLAQQQADDLTHCCPQVLFWVVQL